MHTARDTRGFSLIELLFAMALITVVVLGAIRLQVSNLALSATLNHEARAYGLARQALTIVEGLGYDSVNPACMNYPCRLVLSKANNAYSLTSSPSEETLDDGLFMRSLVFESTDEAHNLLTNALRATAEVTWTDSTGDHSVALQRFILKP